MVAASLAVNVTDWVEEYVPPTGLAVAVGEFLSMVYTWVTTVPVLPTVSFAKNFKVVVDEIEIGEL